MMLPIRDRHALDKPGSNITAEDKRCERNGEWEYYSKLRINPMNVSTPADDSYGEDADWQNRASSANYFRMMLTPAEKMVDAN